MSYKEYNEIIFISYLIHHIRHLKYIGPLYCQVLLMKENNDQMMDFDVLMTKSNGHMETQFIYKRMALPKDSVDVDGLTLTLTDKRTHGNVGFFRDVCESPPPCYGGITL